MGTRQKGTVRASGGGASGGMRKVEVGLAGVRKPGGVLGAGAGAGAGAGVGGVGGATSCRSGGCTAGEAGEALDFLQGRGEGEDMEAFVKSTKNGTLYRPKCFSFFQFFLNPINFEDNEPSLVYICRCSLVPFLFAFVQSFARL